MFRNDNRKMTICANANLTTLVDKLFILIITYRVLSIVPQYKNTGKLSLAETV